MSPCRNGQAWELRTKCCQAPVYFPIGAEGQDGYFHHCASCGGWCAYLLLRPVVSAERPQSPEPPPKSYVRATRGSPAPATAGADDALAAMGSRVRRVARERRS